jgi:pimeloyl-ACP methyl ester carboxylesterase
MGHIFDPVRLTGCRDALAQRADLRRYTTSSAAADYGPVLDALGYGQVNIWAVSYGTRLGLELVRRMPQRVRTLILEGAVPSFFTWPSSGARDAEAALNTLIRDCEAEPGCASIHPTFRRDVASAFAALATRPAAATVFDPYRQQTARVPFAASDLAYATRGLLYGPEALTLPRLFRLAASGQHDALAQAYVTRARALGRELATGVHLGVYCAEDVPYVDMAVAREMAAGTHIGSYLLDQYSRACELWPRGELPAGFRDPVRSAVPTLIMTGRRDPVTPPWSAEAVAKTLSRARVVTWPSGAHGFDGLASPSCKRGIIGDFVRTANVDDVSEDCIRGTRKLPFVGS